MTGELTYWNNDAANYDARAKKSHKAYQTILTFIKNEISTEMDILDMGTGTGEIPIGIFSNVKSINAIDFSHEMIRIARKKARKKGIINISFLVEDGNQLNFEDNSFDVILIINLLHIVPEPENIINEAKRLIKKEGKIIVVTFLNNENLKSRLISYIMKSKGHPITTPFTTNTICEFITKHSLKIITRKNIKNIMPIMYLTCSN